MGLWESIKNIMVIPDEDEFENESVETPERVTREKVYEETDL